MADDLADYPIVVLEADYPEQVGKVGLFDYLMPVGTTGIVFVAAVPGVLYLKGPTFSAAVRVASNLRAASTLVQMGLINGQTFTFLRDSLQLSQSDLATQLGVTLGVLQSWENGSAEIPWLAWKQVAHQVLVADKRVAPVVAACPQNFRARKIRVFPHVPAVSTALSYTSAECDPGVYLVGPNCDPPVSC